MSTLTTVNGMQIVTPTPTGLGGQALNNNFTAIGTTLSTLESQIAGIGSSLTVTGSISGLSGAFVLENNGGVNQIELSSTNSGKTAVVFEDRNQVPIFKVGADSITTSFSITDGASNSLLLINSTTKALSTFNNQLDDGTGDASFVGDVEVSGSLYGNSNTLDDGTGGMVIAGPVQGSSATGPTLFTAIKGISISGSSVISTGAVGSVEIPFNCTVTKWAVVSTDGTSGSIAFDVQQSTFGSALYTSTTGNSIVGNGAGGVYPNLTSQSTNYSSILTHWTTSLTGGDYLVFVVNGTPVSVKNVRLELTLVPR